MKNNIFKLGIFFTVFVIFGFFIFRNFPEIIKTFDVTTQSLTVWILLAFVVGIASYFFIIKSNQKAFEMVKLKISFKRMLRLNLSALATNTLVPSVGVSGGIVFVEDAQSHNYSPSAAVAGHILYILSDYSAVMLLLASSLFYLAITRSMMASVTIPVLIFLLIIFGLYLLLFLAHKDSKRAKKFLGVALKPVLAITSIFTKKKSHSAEVSENFFNELKYASGVIRNNPQSWIEAIGWTTINHLFKLASLYILFFSTGYDIKPSVLLAGYIIGIVVLIVSPTPSGIGFVEGSMVIVFTALGVPREVATTVTLIYRGFQFWIPFLAGLFFLQRNSLKKIRKDMVKEC